MPEKDAVGWWGHPWRCTGYGYWTFWVVTSLINNGQVGFEWLIVTSYWAKCMLRHLEMFQPKKIFSWGAGVTHGVTQMKQKSLRINMLRWDIAHRPKMVNRTWMTVNNSSYMHWHQYSWSKPEMGSWGRPWRCTNEAKTLSIHHFELLCCDSAVGL